MKLSERIIAIATSQIGVQEIPKGSNSGPEIDQYLKSVGLGKGYAWCMAFVYWCVEKSCTEQGVANPLLKTAGVLRQWNERPSLRQKQPQAGDIFIMDFGKGLGHTGIVTKVLFNNRIETIEGNTNSQGSREGQEVAKRIRTISSCKGFLRPTV
jgi:hypothetical protein